MAGKLNMELMGKAELALVRGENPHAVAQALAVEFDMTERTVWRYFRLVRERWATEEEELRPKRREQFRAMVMENFRLAMDDANPMAGAATLRVLAKLDGLEAPGKLEITTAYDVRSMSPLERQAEIERLLLVRAAHLDGRLATPMLGNGKANGKATKH